MKYKILLAFSLGFIFATVIGIYKQESVAGKANARISQANKIIAELQGKQMELEDLKNQIQKERTDFRQAELSLHDRILQLQSEFSNYECPSVSSNHSNGVFMLPSVFEMTISKLTYTCKQKIK